MTSEPKVLTRTEKEAFCIESSEEFGIIETPYELGMYQKDLQSYDNDRLDEEVEWLSYLWDK